MQNLHFFGTFLGVPKISPGGPKKVKIGVKKSAPKKGVKNFRFSKPTTIKRVQKVVKKVAKKMRFLTIFLNLRDVQLYPLRE